MTRAAARVATTAALASLLSAADASAQRPPSAVAVREAGCADVPASSAAWSELLRVELAADGVRVDPVDLGVASPPGRDELLAEATACRGSFATSVTLTFSAGGARRVRRVSLAEVEPSLRPRVLAMAAAELIRASLAAPAPPLTPGAPATADATAADRDAERAARPPDMTLHVAIETVPAPRRADESRPDPAALSLAGEVRSFVRGHAGLLGGRAGVALPLAGPTTLMVDGGALFASARDDLGDVDGTLASMGLGVEVASHGPVTLGIGPRVEVGAAWFRGRASAASTAASSASSSIVLAGLSARVAFRLGAALSGFLALDGGTSLYGYGARADARTALDFSGPMLSTRIGFAWTFGDAASRDAPR